MVQVFEGADPNEVKAREALSAKQDRTEGILAYVAMMADVDIPEEEECHE